MSKTRKFISSAFAIMSKETLNITDVKFNNEDANRIENTLLLIANIPVRICDINKKSLTNSQYFDSLLKHGKVQLLDEDKYNEIVKENKKNYKETGFLPITPVSSYFQLSDLMKDNKKIEANHAPKLDDVIDVKYNTMSKEAFADFKKSCAPISQAVNSNEGRAVLAQSMESILESILDFCEKYINIDLTIEQKEILKESFNLDVNKCIYVDSTIEQKEILKPSFEDLNKCIYYGERRSGKTILAIIIALYNDYFGRKTGFIAASMMKKYLEDNIKYLSKYVPKNLSIVSNYNFLRGMDLGAIVVDEVDIDISLLEAFKNAKIFKFQGSSEKIDVNATIFKLSTLSFELNERINKVAEMWNINVQLIKDMFKEFGLFDVEDKEAIKLLESGMIIEEDIINYLNKVDTRIKLIKLRQGLEILFKKQNEVEVKEIHPSQMKDYDLIAKYANAKNSFSTELCQELLNRLNGTKEFAVFRLETLELDVGLTLSKFRAIKANQSQREASLIPTIIAPFGFFPVKVNDKILYERLF